MRSRPAQVRRSTVPSRRIRFPPRNIAWRKLISFGISRSGVDLFQGFDLRRSEADIGFSPLAKQNRGVKAAARRVVNETVFQSVHTVTGIKRGSFNGFHLLSRDVAR